jgi:hypothetical protein
VRSYHADAARQSTLARERQQLREARRMLDAAKKSTSDLEPLIAERDGALSAEARALLEDWPRVRQRYEGEEQITRVRDREIRTTLTTTSLSGTRIRKVALPKFEDDGEMLRWLMRENLPGYFPYTAGVFPFKRENEDPTRMFAGEGDAFRTNARFKFLSRDMPAKRLSTAFDSVTLYGFDPHERPDIYGKVGNSGVSIATLEVVPTEGAPDLLDAADRIVVAEAVAYREAGEIHRVLAVAEVDGDAVAGARLEVDDDAEGRGALEPLVLVVEGVVPVAATEDVASAHPLHSLVATISIEDVARHAFCVVGHGHICACGIKRVAASGYL